MSNLARAIDHVDGDALETLCDAWLSKKGVTLWQSFDLSEDKDAAAEWLAETLISVDTFAATEFEWKQDDDEGYEDRVRSDGSYREDFDSDSEFADREWGGLGYPS